MLDFTPARLVDDLNSLGDWFTHLDTSKNLAGFDLGAPTPDRNGSPALRRGQENS